MYAKVNTHATSGEKCVEIVKTLHVKFFPFGSVEPVRSVSVNLFKNNQSYVRFTRDGRTA